MPALAKPEPRQLQGQTNPFVDQIPKAVIVLQLLTDFFDLVGAYRLCGALAVPGEADLRVRAMPERRVGFATAGWATADVVLQRQSAWTQIAQNDNLALDGLDTFFKKLRAVGHGAIILKHPQKNIYRLKRQISTVQTRE